MDEDQWGAEPEDWIGRKECRDKTLVVIMEVGL